MEKLVFVWKTMNLFSVKTADVFPQGFKAVFHNLSTHFLYIFFNFEGEKTNTA